MSEKVLLNINKIGKSIDQAVVESLVSKELPGCFGHCYPDVISLDQQFELDEVSEHRLEGVPSTIPMMSVISNNSGNVYQDRVITEVGVSKIHERKNSLVANYADQLKKCSTCKLFDRCSEITKNYAQAVSMNLVLKLKNI